MRRVLLVFVLLNGCFFGAARAQTVATPVLTAPFQVSASGQAAAEFSVAVTDSTSGAKIYYTTNGTTPTTSSSYVSTNGSILIPKSETLEVMAGASGYSNSSVVSGAYTLTGAVSCGFRDSFGPEDRRHGMGMGPQFLWPARR